MLNEVFKSLSTFLVGNRRSPEVSVQFSKNRGYLTGSRRVSNGKGRLIFEDA